MPKNNNKKIASDTTVDNLIKVCHEIAKGKGWWDKERSDGEVIALMHSELSEALEAMRNSHPKEALAEELADCCIRIFDYCGQKKIDLGEALLKKIEKNKGRPYRHGKVF
ncbi:MAG: MazG nucleotide pyrophosphohydrolase domain-containing protein [Candidatus Omnitrophica bacterium]|nr:MazG nucleotide pyrophosphohydrolase domain-containing protein [Candidatus Omnitrophota bacterium]MDD5355679.1 MazG nucleotide pyrophosphohydrolase domain-containing protein [Candidatus Omnitrophota bacterium]